MNFAKFIGTHKITQVRRKAIPFRILNPQAMEFDLARLATELTNGALMDDNNTILDIHLLGGEVRATIAFVLHGQNDIKYAWHYGFNCTNVATPTMLITDKDMREVIAVEVIYKELRKYVINCIKRKPYILLKPSVLKAISLC